VPEALALVAAARPAVPRLRGLVRMGERRWDLVLDRDQRILLPETRARCARWNACWRWIRPRILFARHHGRRPALDHRPTLRLRAAARKPCARSDLPRPEDDQMTDLYQSQRAMRQMRKAAMQRGVIAVLDVGTTKIACLILRFDGPDSLPASDGVGPMAGQSQFRVIGAAPPGRAASALARSTAMIEAERAIRTVCSRRRRMAGTRVDHVIACFSGAAAAQLWPGGRQRLADNVVTEQDIARVLAACDMPDLGEGREVLHAQPVNFALDHRSGLADPRGQIGQPLAVRHAPAVGRPRPRSNACCTA
jgi:hypothetical protein